MRNKKGETLEIDNNPFSLASKDIIHNWVTKNAESIARECVNELVIEYMMEAHMNFLLKNRYIPKLAAEAAEDGINEVAIEEIINDKVDQMVRELAPAMIEVQYEELVQEATDKELDKAAKNHVRRIFLDILLGNLRGMIMDKSEKELIADSALGKDSHDYVDDDGVVFKDDDNKQ